jgi:hypothetical protein
MHRSRTASALAGSRDEAGNAKPAAIKTSKGRSSRGGLRVLSSSESNIVKAPKLKSKKHAHIRSVIDTGKGRKAVHLSSGATVSVGARPRPKTAAARAAAVPTPCADCEVMDVKIAALEVELVNAQEDAREAKLNYDNLRAEGTQLYEAYDSMSARIKHEQGRVAMLAEGLGDHEEVCEQYRVLYGAYNATLERCEELQSTMLER